MLLINMKNLKIKDKDKKKKASRKTSMTDNLSHFRKAEMGISEKLFLKKLKKTIWILKFLSEMD